jgi:cytochrome c oxidase subunit 2
MGVEERPTEQETPVSERVGVRHMRANVRQMFAIGGIVSVCGIALALIIDWFPVAASKQAKPVDTLWDVLLIVSVPIFVLVQTVVLYSVWKFRMRPGEELLDGPPIHGNTRLEIVWTAIPAMLLVALCSYAFLVLTDIEKAQANTMKVRVVGEQFTWTFYYPGSGGREVASPQLYLPVNQAVEFTIQSKDVLHDFWVPAFRIKKDAVPGINTSYRVTTTRVGDYPVVCAELCGLGHSVMRQTAHVVPRGQFQQWLNRLRSKQGAPGAAPGGQAPSGTNGKQIFLSLPCKSCHTLKDAGTTATVGPDLDKGLKGKTPAFIKESIVSPDKVITPGYSAGIMPSNFGQTIPPAQLDALVKYLSDVTKGG